MAQTLRPPINILIAFNANSGNFEKENKMRKQENDQEREEVTE